MKRAIILAIALISSDLIADDIYLAKEVLSNPRIFNNKVISVIGKLSLAHSEEINVGGIELAWGCYNQKDTSTYEESWHILDTWRDSGLDKKIVTVRGKFIVDTKGEYSQVPNTPVMVLIESLKYGSKEMQTTCGHTK